MLTIIPNCNIVDVASQRVIHSHDILIDAGLIVDLRPSGKINAEWRVVGGGPDAWIMPGLIDAHVHLLEIFEGPTAGQLPDEKIDDAIERGIANLKTCVSVGITTVRDVGAYQARNNLLRDTVASMSTPIARIVSCGHHLTVHGGHFWERGKVWEPNKLTIEALVGDVVSEGADFIKVMNDDKIFNHTELKAIVHTAHNLGKHVACHAFTSGQILQAIECGVDTIEHGFPATEEIHRLLRETGTSLCPTIVAAVDSLKDSNRDAICAAFPDCSALELENWFNNLKIYMPSAFGCGLSIIAGTDAGILPTPFNSIHREIELFKSFGASNWEVILATTIASARALRIANITGQIAPGKSADLLLLRSNPAFDLLSALRKIDYVMYSGKIVHSAYE